MDEFRAQVESLVEDDNKPELVQLLRSRPETYTTCCDVDDMQLASFIMSSCIKFSAVNCASALFNGETGLSLELHKPGVYPLHAAAGALSPQMTKFLLKIGVPAAQRITDCGTDDGLLPVDFALRSIRERVFWTQEESLLALFADLTGRRMFEAKETLRLLFSELSESEISEVLFRYAAEAKMIELAALLLVSPGPFSIIHIHMPATDRTPGEQMTLRQYVVNEVVVLENKVRKLVHVDEADLDRYREMKKSMMSVLMLVEIFLRAGDKILSSVEPYPTVTKQCPTTAHAIACVFEDYGFKLTGEDASYITEERRYIFKENDDLLSDYDFKQGSFETMPDFGLDDTNPEHQKLLPMREALRKISSVIRKWGWTYNQSVFKLIIMLCLPMMKEILGAANLIPQNSEKINEIACYYAKEGNLVELAIILILALQKVKDPIVFQINGESSKRSITFQQFINCELAQAIDLEYRLIGRTTVQEKDLSKICRQRKSMMLSALTLLEISEKAGLALQTYLQTESNIVRKEQVIRHISNLLLEAGFMLKPEDTKICTEVGCSPEMSSGVQDEVEDQVKNSGFLLNPESVPEMDTESGAQVQDITRLSYVLPGGFVESSTGGGRAYDMSKFLLKRYPEECYALPSGVQSFRAFWTSKARKAYYSTCIPKAMEARPRSSVRLVNQLLRMSTASKKVLSVVVAVKRQIKYA